MKQENSTLIDQNSDKSSENGYSAFTPITEEETLKQQNSRKKELIAGAIGDGVNAFANLFFASKGAPISHSKGKEKMPTLYDRIYGRHKKDDEAYNTKFNAWEKENEKKRKEAEKNARENERIEDIHPDFQPLARHWDDRVWIDMTYDKMKGHIKDHVKQYNTKQNKGVIKQGLNPDDGKYFKEFIPSEESKVLDYLNSKNTDGEKGRHEKHDLIYNILSGEYKTDELDDEFLDFLRTELMDFDNSYHKIK